MSRKLSRLVMAASVAAGFILSPMAAHASDRFIVVDDGQFNGGNKNLDVYLGDVVYWELAADAEQNHSIVPQSGRGGGNTWPGEPKPSGDLEKGKPFSFTFNKPGKFFYFCERHPDTMKDYYVYVVDPNATTTTTTPPATTPPTSPPATTPPAPTTTTTTTSAPASSQGNKPPTTAAPAPTTTTAKDKKNKDDKKDEETTTTTLPPPPPVDLPDSAIVPGFPGFDSTATTTQNGIEAPDGAPEGDAIALLKSKKGGSGRAMTLLIVSGLGLGALGIGTAGYKYANRSSKYFPA